MKNENIKIQERLLSLQDTKYREFHSRLMPTIAPERVIGVRTPLVRKYAAELAGTPEADSFMSELPHFYYEENNLHAFLIERIKDYGGAIEAIERFLPYVDNWATCDSMSPKIFRKHLPELYEKIKEWLKSDKTYTVRFAMGMLMNHYLDDAFRPEMLDLAAAIRSDEYYINMMTAWYIATALYKQEKAALRIITEERLDIWTHNKAIQKAVESYRISDEMKTYLRSLRR